METDMSRPPERETAPAVRLRPMDVRDLDGAHTLSRREKWPHRAEDWEYMLSIGEGVVAERDGRIIGTILVWKHDEHTATLGMVIVSQQARGQGLGRKLMQAALERAGTRAVRLNATQDGLALYESMGFVEVGAILQHQGTALPVPIVQLDPGVRVRPLGKADADVVLAFDRAATGMTRPKLMADLMADSRGVVLDRDGEALGFAFFRRFGFGSSISPVVAPDAQGAKAMIAYWLSLHSGMFVRLDVTEAGGLSPWLEDNGMANVARIVTMVRGQWPDTPAPETSFAIVSQALG